MGDGISLFGPWQKAYEICDSMQERFKRTAKKAVLQEANFLRGKIIEGLREQAPGGQAFAPLSPLTLAIRAFEKFKGSKALIRKGDLRNAIVVKSSENGDAFVGVLRTAKSKTGESLVNIAEMNENGAGPIIVPITPASRRYFHAALEAAGLAPPKNGPTGGGAAIAIVRIPPRPFLAPVFAKYETPDSVRNRFYRILLEEMQTDLGTP